MLKKISIIFLSALIFSNCMLGFDIDTLRALANGEEIDLKGKGGHKGEDDPFNEYYLLDITPFFEWSAHSDQEGQGGSSEIYMEETEDGRKHFSGYVDLVPGEDWGNALAQAVPDDVTLKALTAANGITFMFRGDGRKYKVEVKTSDVKNYNYFQIIFDSKEYTEERIAISYSSLKQNDWGGGSEYVSVFNKNNITDIAIHARAEASVSGPGNFNFTVWDLKHIASQPIVRTSDEISTMLEPVNYYYSLQEGTVTISGNQVRFNIDSEQSTDNNACKIIFPGLSSRHKYISVNFILVDLSIIQTPKKAKLTFKSSAGVDLDYTLECDFDYVGEQRIREFPLSMLPNNALYFNHSSWGDTGSEKPVDYTVEVTDIIFY